MVWARPYPVNNDGGYAEAAPAAAKSPTTTSFTNKNSSNKKTRSSMNPSTPRLNDALQTQYIDLSEEDQSCLSNLTRTITKFVGSLFTPGQVLGMVRVLRAATLLFLALGLISMLMYILFVQIIPGTEVRYAAGGIRDIMLRLYGIFFSLFCVAIEMDYAPVTKKFAVLKGFIPRAFLFFLISQLCAPRPIAKDLARQAANNNYYGNDDNTSSYSAYQPPQIPTSAIGFQRVTSFLLSCCALGYLICGVLCLDRFTARAFLSRKDPRVTTAIPPAASQPGAVAVLSDESSLFGEDDEEEGMQGDRYGPT